jgi:hypothetical protein
LAPPEDDYDIFTSRVSSLPEVSIYLSGSSIPPVERHPAPGTRAHNAFSPTMRSAIEGHSGNSNSSTSYDSQSMYSSASRSPASKATSIHLIATSDGSNADQDDDESNGHSNRNGADNATLGGKSFKSTRSTKSTKTLQERAIETGVPVHKLAFNEFHNQVRAEVEVEAERAQRAPRISYSSGET